MSTDIDIHWRCWYSLFISKKFTRLATIDNSTQKGLVLPENLTGAEIGVFRGENVISLLTHIPWLKKLYCIDMWKEYDEYNKELKNNFPDTKLTLEEEFNNFKKTVAPFSNRVEILRMNSIKAANLIEDDSLDFVFIDGNHEYNSVKNDIMAYIPKIKVKGILSGHDYIRFKGEPEHRYEVKKAVDEIFPSKNIEGTIWWVERIK